MAKGVPGWVDYAGNMDKQRHRSSGGGSGGPVVAKGLSGLPWGLIMMIIAVALAGTAMLYSSTITNPEEGALPLKHVIRFGISFVIMLGVAFTPLRIWLSLAFPVYIAALALLVGVEFFGEMGGGAQRWLAIGPIDVQPSEFMKLALVLAMAHYYHVVLSKGSGGFWIHIPALLLIMAPAAFIFRQPDFGTTLALMAAGGVIIFLAGLLWRVIIAGAITGLASIVPIYFVVLADYQRERVDTFLAQLLGNSVDATGDGYQIEQAHIAIGSGGWNGKGFTNGTQAQLDYIPEQHTDFILTVVAEEGGFLFTSLLLLTWAVILGWGLLIAVSAKSRFGRFAAAGAVGMVAFYIVFNVSMVLGLVPVVGMPMPLVSYGGTAMMTTMAAFGIILSVHLNRDNGLTT